MFVFVFVLFFVFCFLFFLFCLNFLRPCFSGFAVVVPLSFDRCDHDFHVNFVMTSLRQHRELMDTLETRNRRQEGNTDMPEQLDVYDWIGK